MGIQIGGFGTDLTDMTVGIGGALLGALVGGAISYLLQRKQFQHERALRENERKEINQTLARQSVFKLNFMLGDLKMIQDHLEEGLSRHPEEKENLWRFIVPMANNFNSAPLLPNEVALVYEADNRLANDIVLFEKWYQSRTNAFHLYNIKRGELKDLMPTYVQNGVGTVELTQEEIERLSPYWAEMDGLLNYLISIKDDVVSGKEYIKALVAAYLKAGIARLQIQFVGDPPPPDKDDKVEQKRRKFFGAYFRVRKGVSRLILSASFYIPRRLRKVVKRK